MLRPFTNYPLDPRNISTKINELAETNPEKAGELALQFFCTPQEERPFTQEELQFIAGSRQFRLAVDALEIQAYHWPGSGPKVVLAHGWGSNGARWRPIISWLTMEGFDVLTFDAPGHGQSEGTVSHVASFAKALAATVQYQAPDIILGHSLGGMGAAYYLSKMQGSVDRLVLMSSPSSLKVISEKYCQLLNLNQAARAALYHIFEATLGFRLEYFDTANFMKSLNVPGLIIHDKLDESVPYQAACEIHEAWQGSTLITTENQGHSLQTPLVYKKLLEFCRT